MGLIIINLPSPGLPTLMGNTGRSQGPIKRSLSPLTYPGGPRRVDMGHLQALSSPVEKAQIISISASPSTTVGVIQGSSLTENVTSATAEKRSSSLRLRS